MRDAPPQVHSVCKEEKEKKKERKRVREKGRICVHDNICIITNKSSPTPNVMLYTQVGAAPRGKCQGASDVKPPAGQEEETNSPRIYMRRSSRWIVSVSRIAQASRLPTLLVFLFPPAKPTIFVPYVLYSHSLPFARDGNCSVQEAPPRVLFFFSFFFCQNCILGKKTYGKKMYKDREKSLAKFLSHATIRECKPDRSCMIHNTIRNRIRLHLEL